MTDPKRHFLLAGFREQAGFRIFNFEAVSPKQERIPFTVQADLALARRYGIPLQELPLLCRAILDRLDEAEVGRAFTYTEDEMCSRAVTLAARRLAENRRRNPRRPDPEALGQAWRTPQS